MPEAGEAWQAAQDAGWGDVLRLHGPGRRAAQALDQARSLVASAVGARPDEVVFVPTGIHASTAAVAGLAKGRARIGRGLVASSVEHSSVLTACEAYGDRRLVPVDSQARLDLDAWRQAVAEPGLAAACLQVANHEVGTVQPFREAIEACRAVDVPLVLDATSALGRLNLTESGDWSVLTGWAGAFGGPASVGFLIIRRGTRWRAPYPVDEYQDGRWPGPVDVPSVVAAAVALQTWIHDQAEIAQRQHRLVEALRVAVAQTVPDADVVGDPDHRLPHLLTFSALYLDGEALTLELDRAGFAVASGSACSARSEVPSHVLAAMGALTHGNVRLGLIRTTAEDDVKAFLHVLPQIVARMRATLDL